MGHKRLRPSFETRKSALLRMTAVYVLRFKVGGHGARAPLPTLRFCARCYVSVAEWSISVW